MKKITSLLLLLFPFFLVAQNDCNFFKDVIVRIEKTNLNTTNSDFGPAFVNNELWHSAFTNKEISKLSRGATKNVFYNLFVSETDGTGNIIGEKELRLEKISADYHAGPVSYCESTKELFVTLSNYENPEIKNTVFQKADIRLKIVIVKEINGEWELIEELPFNRPSFSVGHPAISVTGDTLFFASNIPDYGFGKTDLYMSIRKDGEWGKLINLGNQINSEGNEMFPFLFRNNMLIFSSNGKDVNEVDLDLYYTCLTENGFTDPQRLDEFNTVSDDFGLVIHPDEEVGYYTSRKRGGIGNDDIYKVVFEKIPMVEIKGKVIDDITELAIGGALVALTDCAGEQIATTKSNENGEFTFLSNPADCLKANASKTPYREDEKEVDNNFVLLRLKGDYKLELLVRDKNSLEVIPNAAVEFSDNKNLSTAADGYIKRGLAHSTDYTAQSKLEGYMNESVEFTTVDQPFSTIYRVINVEKVVVGQKFTLENIFYDFDKWDILPESEIELNKLIKVMNDNPEWEVELGSHTDSRGTDSYNAWLSQKRSDSAVGYIVKNGIPKSRIVAKGYGETQLVNQCSNGVKCSDADHRKNRRTEFKILGM